VSTHIELGLTRFLSHLASRRLGGDQESSK